MREIGHVMPDKTIFAGISPVSGFAMYACPHDYPVTCGFTDAIKNAYKSSLMGYRDWRVPHQEELGVLYINRREIGGFQGKTYRCSSPHYLDVTWGHNFSNGQQVMKSTRNLLFVRLVRGRDL